MVTEIFRKGARERMIVTVGFEVWIEYKKNGQGSRTFQVEVARGSHSGRQKHGYVESQVD